MRDLAGWELLLGGALVVWVLWRFGRGSSERLEPGDKKENKTLPTEAEGEDQSNDWAGLLFPLIAVVAFVFFLISLMRS